MSDDSQEQQQSVEQIAEQHGLKIEEVTAKQLDLNDIRGRLDEIELEAGAVLQGVQAIQEQLHALRDSLNGDDDDDEDDEDEDEEGEEEGAEQADKA